MAAIDPPAGGRIPRPLRRYPFLAVAALPFACVETPPPVVASTASSSANIAPEAPPRAGADASPDGAVIRLERTACLGTCPVYTVEVHGDGEVIYEGTAFVGVKGRETKRISAKDARALFTLAEDGAFFQMADRYELFITDNPSAVVTVTMGGRTKAVVDYPPCHRWSGPGGARAGPNSPAALCAIETRLDEMTGSAEWTRCPGDCPW